MLLRKRILSQIAKGASQHPMTAKFDHRICRSASGGIKHLSIDQFLTVTSDIARDTIKHPKYFEFMSSIANFLSYFHRLMQKFSRSGLEPLRKINCESNCRTKSHFSAKRCFGVGPCIDAGRDVGQCKLEILSMLSKQRKPEKD